MKYLNWTALGLTVILGGTAALALWHATVDASGWAIGDVFAGTEDGTYDVYDNSGTFKETISQAPLGYAGTGCAFNPFRNKLYTTNFDGAEVVVFADTHPHPIVQSIDTAAQNGFGPGTESIVFAANGDFYVGNAEGNADIQRFNAAGVFQQQYDVAVEVRGSDWIDLARDQKTMFYTSEGRQIQRYDVSGAGAQLAPFATLTAGDNAFALRLLPPGDGSGGLLVADSSDIHRLDGLGNVVQTYDAAGEDHWFALSLDPNGTSFWSAGNYTADFYRFNIGTGAIEVGPVHSTSGSQILGLCLKGEPTAAQATPVPVGGVSELLAVDSTDGSGGLTPYPALAGGLMAAAALIVGGWYTTRRRWLRWLFTGQR